MKVKVPTPNDSRRVQRGMGSVKGVSLSLFQDKELFQNCYIFKRSVVAGLEIFGIFKVTFCIFLINYHYVLFLLQDSLGPPIIKQKHFVLNAENLENTKGEKFP